MILSLHDNEDGEVKLHLQVLGERQQLTAASHAFEHDDVPQSNLGKAEGRREVSSGNVKSCLNKALLLLTPADAAVLLSTHSPAAWSYWLPA